MKIAFFAKTHRRSRITRHIHRGLASLGHDVRRFNWRKVRRNLGARLGRRFVEQRLERFAPDWILVFTRDIDLELLRDLSTRYRTAQLHDDCDVPLRPEVLDYARTVHDFFVTARGQLEAYRQAGVARPHYVTGGCDPRDHYRVEPSPKFASEVAFIGKPGVPGTPGEADRVALMRWLGERFDLHVYGPGWEEHGVPVARRNVYPRHYRKICASAGAVIGIDTHADVDLYFSNRTWITLGCGGALCTRYVPSLEECFTDGRELLWWRSPDECGKAVERLLRDPALRASIQEQGHAYAHREYSYARMAERMLAAVATADA